MNANDKWSVVFLGDHDKYGIIALRITMNELVCRGMELQVAQEVSERLNGRVPTTPAVKRLRD